MRTSRAFQSDVSKRMFGWRSAVVRVQIGDRAVGEHDLRAGVALEQPGEVARQRRHGAARVEEHRHASLGGQRERAVQRRVREVEAGQARVELDAARAGVERRAQLGQEPLARLAAAERRDAPVTGRGRGQHLGVGGRVAGAWRRLERERAGPGDATGIHRREQPGEIEARAVGRVLAQVRVHVDERSGHQRPHVRAPDALECGGGVFEFGWHGGPS